MTVQRYIVRMPGGTFDYNTDLSDTDDTDFFPEDATFIEASDVMGLADGSTWSKHYNGGLYGRIKDCTSISKLCPAALQTNFVQSTTLANPARPLACG